MQLQATLLVQDTRVLPPEGRVDDSYMAFALLPLIGRTACSSLFFVLTVQLSRCPTLDGIMLVSKVRDRDFVGNRVPNEMSAHARLEKLSENTLQEAVGWFGEQE